VSEARVSETETSASRAGPNSSGLKRRDFLRTAAVLTAAGGFASEATLANPSCRRTR
jgi:hypothetical protein